jgi:hypothetical protein
LFAAAKERLVEHSFDVLSREKEFERAKSGNGTRHIVASTGNDKFLFQFGDHDRLGGHLIEVLSWRAIFFVNVPVGLLSAGIRALGAAGVENIVDEQQAPARDLERDAEGTAVATQGSGDRPRVSGGSRGQWRAPKRPGPALADARGHRRASGYLPNAADNARHRGVHTHGNRKHTSYAGGDFQEALVDGAGGLADRQILEGGPVGATEVMVYKIYFDGFKGLDYSGAAAQSIILMLLVICLTFVQFKWVERRIHYS